MRRYLPLGIKSGIVALVLVTGWIYQIELMEWFAPDYRVEQEHDHNHGEDDIAYWTCPMHPSVKAEEAGPCPICGMDLQPVPAVQAAIGGTSTSQPTSQPTSQQTSQSMVGASFITLTPWQRQLIGVTTAPVEQKSMQTTLRTVGWVAYDETRLADVHLKIRGWIEELYVDYMGKPVRRGQPLFALYSPELVSTQEEYLLALHTLRSMESDTGEDRISREAITRQQSLLKATRRRLRLWDLDETQINALDEEGQPQRTVTISAPAAGIVVDKMAVEGMYATPGMRLYRIASLDTVWVYADVYEHELSLVHEGQLATVELPYMPGKSFQGRVDYVYPYLDTKTRTARMRIEVPNQDGRLKPDMYADVLLTVESGTQLAVPENAVLFSGRRRVVFVDLGGGRFQPREIRLGARMGDSYQVLEGLDEAEQVVTSAHFLLDSESKLKNVMAGMATPYEQGAKP